MKKLYPFIMCIMFFLGNIILYAEDVYRFRGDNSQGKYNETGLLESWPEEGLTPLWINEELGAGWGSVIKVGNRLYLNALDADNKDRESIICLDLQGKKIWQVPIGIGWIKAYPDARSTPTYIPGKTVEDGLLITMSGAGEIFCLKASDGAVQWSEHLGKKYNMKYGYWGLAESVVYHDDKVFVTVCGDKIMAIALKIEDGSVVWETPTIGDDCAYASPIIFENQLVIMTGQKIVGIDRKTGKLLWKDNYQDTAGGAAREKGIHCNSPTIKGNQIFVSSGYDQGGVMYEILPNNEGIKVLWMRKTLDPHHGGAVEVNGRLYGSSWINNDSGKWVCLDWKTGDTIYEEPWGKYSKGVIIYADGKLYIYEEKRGQLGLVNPGDQFDVISSFPIKFGSKQHWSHPIISDGILYVRRGKALAAFDIRCK